MSNFTGIYLKKLRTQSGMTQSELAKKLGYQSATAVELLEIGKTPLDPEHVNALARILMQNPMILLVASNQIKGKKNQFICRFSTTAQFMTL